MGRVRLILSRLLSAVFSRGLSVRVRDVSSGLRIYPARALETLAATADDFDILPELLVRAHAEGWRIVEIPFTYEPRGAGSSKARLLRLGAAYVRTFVRLWRLRSGPIATTKRWPPTTTSARMTAPSRFSARGSADGTRS